MMRSEWEFVPGLGRIAAYAYAYAYAYVYVYVDVYAAARMHKKTRGQDRAFFCLETD